MMEKEPAAGAHREATTDGSGHESRPTVTVPSPGTLQIVRHRTNFVRNRTIPTVAGALLVAPLLLAGPGPGPDRGPAGPLPGADPSPGFDVLRYDLRLSLHEESREVAARQRVEFLVTRAGLGGVRLHLAGLAVDSARAGERRVNARRDGPESVRVPLPDSGTLRPGDTAAVTLFYGGRPADGLVVGRNVHGAWTAFADNWPDRARHWFASVDHPADKAAVAFRVEMPEGWTSVANGLRVEDRPLPGGRRLQVWEQEEPIPVYTMVVGAGRLAEVRAGSARSGRREVPVTHVLFPPDVERGEEPFRRAAEMVRVFTRLVAPYPYRKLALVQSSTRYGGMENSSAIFFPEAPLADGTLGETIVAHEIAHQWFGDGVTESRWTHLWLSEGFATYFAALFYEAADGPAEFREEMARLEDGYLGSDAVGRPVLRERPEDLTELLDANNYQKGAWVLHMLRATVGDSAFFDGLRRYYLRHRNGTALTADLRRAVEDASGRELGWFFDQWLRRPGHPRLRAGTGWDGGALELVLLQTQEWPPYRLSVPIVVELPDGRSVRRTVWTSSRADTFRISLPERPSRVRVDPENTVLGPALSP